MTFYAEIFNRPYEAEILRLEDEIARQEELLYTLTKKRNDARWEADQALASATDAHGDYLATQNSTWFFEIYLKRLNEAHEANQALIKADADLASANALLEHQCRLYKSLNHRLSHH